MNGFDLRQQDLLKRLYTFTRIHGVISQKTSKLKIVNFRNISQGQFCFVYICFNQYSFTQFKNIFVCWTYSTGFESTRKLLITESGQARNEVIIC